MTQQVFREIEDWCTNHVRAEDTNINHNGDQVECQIRNGDKKVFMSVSENEEGSVELRGKDGNEQSWSGDIDTLDLHEDGLTVAGERATFSLTWDR